MTGTLASSIAASAHADETRLSGAGIVGGALLGAELTGLGEAVAGVEPTWAFLFGMGIGAGAGAFTGYRLEQDTDPGVSAALLGAGILFLIPSVVWMGNARSTKPPSVRDTGFLHMEGPRARWALPRVDVVYRPGGSAEPAMRGTSVDVSLVSGVF